MSLNKRTLVDTGSLGCEIVWLGYSVPKESRERVRLNFKF
jgi:hypothetical protein